MENVDITGIQLVYEEAIKHNPLVLEHIPEQTERLCLIAVNLDPSVIVFVKDKTDKIVKATLAKNPYYIGAIEPQSDEFCIVAIEHEKNVGIMEVIRNHSDDVLETMLKYNGDYLESIPKDRVTISMCNIAIAQNGRSLKYVDDSMKTYDICNKAVSMNPKAIEYVNRSNLYENVMTLALRQDGLTLRHIPKTLQTEELCKIALNNNWNALEYVKNLSSPTYDRLVSHALGKTTLAVKYAKRLSTSVMIELVRQGVMPNQMQYPTKEVVWHYINYKTPSHLGLDKNLKNIKMNSDVLSCYITKMSTTYLSFVTQMVKGKPIDNHTYHTLVKYKADRVFDCASDTQHIYNMLCGSFNPNTRAGYGYRYRYRYRAYNALPSAESVRNGKAMLMLLSKNYMELCKITDMYDKVPTTKSATKSTVSGTSSVNKTKPKTYRMYMQAVRYSKSRGKVPSGMNGVDIRKRFGAARTEYMLVCKKPRTAYSWSGFRDLDVLKSLLWFTPRNILIVSPVAMCQQLCDFVIDRDPGVIELIGNEYKTFDVCMKCVKYDGMLLEYVQWVLPKKKSASVYQSVQNVNLFDKDSADKLIDAALESNPDAISVLQPHQKTFNRCLKVVTSKPLTIQYIRNHPNQADLEMLAVRTDGIAMDAVSNITLPLALAAIESNGLALQYIIKSAQHLVTEEIKEGALRQNGLVIQFIEDMTLRHASIAITQCGEAIEHIHSTFKYGASEEINTLYDIALVSYPPTIAYMKPRQNLELCERAMEYTMIHRRIKMLSIFNNITHKSPRIYEMMYEYGELGIIDCDAATANYKLIGYRPARGRIPNLPSMSNTGGTLPKDPMGLYKHDIGRAYFSGHISVDGMVIRYLDKPNERECIRAVEQNGLALFLIDNQSKDICLTAIKQNPKAFLFVKRQTEEICKLALQMDSTLDVYVDRLYEHLLPPLMRDID